VVVLHNWDEPGKIGGVGGILGRAGVNVRFMSVAAVDLDVDAEEGIRAEGGNEALMILGVEGEVTRKGE